MAQGTIVIRTEEATMPLATESLPIVAQVEDSRWPLRPGDNPLPVPPGRWTVKVWCPYWGFKVGKAELAVDTSAGQPVLVHYAPPRTVYDRGALGLEPQERHRGNTHIKVAVLGVLGAVVLGLVVLLAFG